MSPRWGLEYQQGAAFYKDAASTRLSSGTGPHLGNNAQICRTPFPMLALAVLEHCW
jgi:hypothetical protein